MTGVRICRRTDMQCATPNMCEPFQGCDSPRDGWKEINPGTWHRYPEKEAVATGWKCVVCGKGNAPFMPTCGNQLCGVDLSKGATA
jgi:hypothetical protein